MDVLSTMEQGVRYTISVWVQLAAGEAASSARVSVEWRPSGTADYDRVVGSGW